jgi:uncharacterized Zn-finger protein
MPDCGKRFTTRFSLKRHYYIHKQEKKFECHLCNKQFVLPQYLKEHQYIHINDDPFICGVNGCNESFKQRGKLSLHRRTHNEFQKKSYRLLNQEINKLRKTGRKQARIQSKTGIKSQHNQTRAELVTDCGKGASN